MQFPPDFTRWQAGAVAAAGRPRPSDSIGGSFSFLLLFEEKVSKTYNHLLDLNSEGNNFCLKEKWLKRFRCCQNGKGTRRVSTYIPEAWENIQSGPKKKENEKPKGTVSPAKNRIDRI